MDKDIAVVTSETIEKCIYVIRGQRVMLDFDLARIYGYTTKDFNRQVKNNIHKFPDDFMFLLSDVETENLRCKNSTSSWGGKRYAPHAFTEQGIYMLMTVLKGELAVRQSITLIRLFKQMKDYLVDNQALVGRQEFVALSSEVDGIKSDLKKVMDSFDDPSTHKEIVILNGEKFTADVAYSRIYKSAKQSIHIVDDYIGIKTLEHLQYAKKNVKITIYSDNKAGRDKLTANLYNDFVAEKYTTQLKDIVVTPLVKDGYLSSWAQHTILLKNAEQRDELKAYLQTKGIPSMVYYPRGMHQQTALKNAGMAGGDFPNTENIVQRCLALPIHPYMTDEQINSVVTAIKEFVK